MPSLAATPLRKFCTKTSDFSASLYTISFASGFLRSRVRLFLWRVFASADKNHTLLCFNQPPRTTDNLPPPPPPTPPPHLYPRPTFGPPPFSATPPCSP